MVSSEGQPLHAFVASAGFEEALREELGAARTSGPRWPAVISARGAVPPCDPVFARQQLPGATLVRAESAEALATGALDAALPAIDAHLAAGTAPIALHVFVPDPQPYRSQLGHAAAIEKALGGRLRQRRPAAHARLARTPAAIAGAAWGGALLVQVAIVGRTVVLASAERPRALPAGGFDLAPWPAGIAPVPEDRRAPSRAYRKLVEGFGWLGARPGEGDLCVDLGGSPGGWAWTALSGGARVIAVDRSPLAPPALGHPQLEMVLGNAFTYEPPAAVDWLLCDVICDPARTFELAARWMANGWCRRVVATVKFKGAGGYAALAPARVRLEALGWSFLRIKHMQNHHNEAVILASR
jgi:23S rRNA (cytidine2498-2'-O)-methyltransferase